MPKKEKHKIILGKKDKNDSIVKSTIVFVLFYTDFPCKAIYSSLR